MDELKSLAEEGNALAQLCYGLMCEHGRGLHAVYAGVRGIPESKTEAAKWYRKAAQQGNAWAKYNLASITNDPDEAFQMFKEAAAQGLAEAQVSLAHCYKVGGIPALKDNATGLQVDLIEAYRWALLAKNQGHPYVSRTNWFDLLERQMTPEQISEAELRANAGDIEEYREDDDYLGKV